MSAPLDAEAARARSRVTRACDRCKKRKIRCSGQSPCRICEQADAPCTFTASYSRGAKRRRMTDSCPERGVAAGSTRQPLSTTSPIDAALAAPADLAPRELGQHRRGHYEPTAAATSPSLCSELGGSVSLQGDYVGPASGVSFLLSAQAGLSSLPPTTLAGAANFSFGDVSLNHQDGEASACLVIPREDMRRLLALYFDFTVPMDRFLHRPTVETWCEEFYSTYGLMKREHNHTMRRALLQVVFALAQQHASAQPSDLHHQLSVRWFLAAEQALVKERGPACLLSVQVRLIQCLWLLSESRINHCWTLFGVTARLALAIGLHRVEEPHRITNHIECECRRRAFWSAYSLDNYLSMTLGRSRIFHDEDIDQEMPSSVEDDDISADSISPAANPSQTLTTATVAYFSLGRIISKVIHNLYSARRLTTAERLAFAQAHVTRLQEWRMNLPSTIDVDGINTSMLIPIVQRQKNVLSLAYHHTVILAHRQLLLHFGASTPNHDACTDEALSIHQQTDSVRECLQAAAHIINIVNNLLYSGQMFRAYWFTPYFAFSAIVIIYVYASKCCCRNEFIEPDSVDLEAAVRCQDRLYNIADKGSLVERYCIVLEGLRRAAVKHMNTHGDAVNGERRWTDWLPVQEAHPNAAATDPSNVHKLDRNPQKASETGSNDNNPCPVFSVDGVSTPMYDFSGDISSMFSGGGTGLEGLLSFDSLWGGNFQ